MPFLGRLLSTVAAIHVILSSRLSLCFSFPPLFSRSPLSPSLSLSLSLSRLSLSLSLSLFSKLQIATESVEELVRHHARDREGRPLSQPQPLMQGWREAHRASAVRCIAGWGGSGLGAKPWAQNHSGVSVCVCVSNCYNTGATCYEDIPVLTEAPRQRLTRCTGRTGRAGLRAGGEIVVVEGGLVVAASGVGVGGERLVGEVLVAGGSPREESKLI